MRIARLEASFSVLEIPGHTRAHVAYYGLESLFCGDTLFACGCGRVFEGTADQIVASLGKLAALPDVVESANKYLGSRIAHPVRVFAAIREWKNQS